MSLHHQKKKVCKKGVEVLEIIDNKGKNAGSNPSFSANQKTVENQGKNLIFNGFFLFSQVLRNPLRTHGKPGEWCKKGVVISENTTFLPNLSKTEKFFVISPHRRNICPFCPRKRPCHREKPLPFLHKNLCWKRRGVWQH